MATEAQIDANRANALKSTGPRTAEGKEAARRNAMKHGLCAETLLLPEDEEAAIAVRASRLVAGMGPADEFEAIVIEEFAAASVLLARCRKHEAVLRTRLAMRATLHWEADREAEAAEIGKALAREPRATVAALRKTLQGCEWLFTQWQRLAAATERRGSWTDPEYRLVLDLLGIPEALWHAPNEVFDHEGGGLGLALEQMAELEALMDGPLSELDAMERSAAEIGMGAVADKALSLARRYQAAAERKFKWTADLLGKNRKPRAETLRVGIIEPDAAPRPDPMEEPPGDVVDLGAVFPMAHPPAEADAEAEAGSPSPNRGPFAGFLTSTEAPRRARPNRKARRAENARDRRNR